MSESFGVDHDRYAPASTPGQELPSGDAIRLTLSAIAEATLDGRLPEDGGFARNPLHREVRAFAEAAYQAGVRAEEMLVELKAVIEETTVRLESPQRRTLMSELVSEAIEAYFARHPAEA